MSKQMLRNSWRNVNKGLFFVLIGIPVALLMGLMYGTIELEIESVWPLLRLEITFMVIEIVSLICYCARYPDTFW